MQPQACNRRSRTATTPEMTLSRIRLQMKHAGLARHHSCTTDTQQLAFADGKHASLRCNCTADGTACSCCKDALTAP
eukprot:5449817-Lingulodinium_polyedra.AAC.1